ncbi:uncharacterized protein LOC108259252 isoform X3 [Ictalurus punctatus]|uniref:Uncharacterized protein LOC108259252 isoform X3 n=1 Tax=Ictalurus punctatus TaxID=7998 RepID=A0A9F7RCJ6_ICTPU|nr:uncharacterized protein LOC108259252 isoform X3 [Ictalurus punctatus]
MTTVLCFYLLVFCGAAESFTEKSVDLGQNVTLKCEVSVNNVFWFLMKPSEPPVFILRSFSSSILEPVYSNTTFSKRFSVQYNSSLFIHNISTNEFGVYYCIQTGSPYNISSGIRLYIQNHSAENQTCKTEQCQNQTRSTAKENSHLPILIISVTFNCVLVIVVTVFTVRHCRRRPKTQAQPSDPGLQPRQDSTSPVYAEVQFSKNGPVRTANGPVRTANGPVRTANLDSTYALVNL